MRVIINTAVEEVRNDLGWTVASKGKKKESLQLTLCEAQPIPIICHCFEPLNTLMNHEVDTFNLTIPQQRNRTHTDKKRIEKGKNTKL